MGTLAPRRHFRSSSAPLQASLFASPCVPGRGSRWARPPPKQGVGKLRGVKPHHRAEGRGAALAISLRQHEDSPQLLADQQKLRALLSISSSPSLSYREGLVVREAAGHPAVRKENNILQKQSIADL